MVKIPKMEKTVVNSTSTQQQSHRKPYISSVFGAFKRLDRFSCSLSVRLSVYRTPQGEAAPPRAEPITTIIYRHNNFILYTAIDHFNLLMYNIYNTHTIICAISNVLHYHALCAVLKCENTAKN